MITFWTYLLTAILTALPVGWLWLGAWMGVPIVATEYLSFLGSLSLLIAGYVSLSFRKAAAVLALCGVAGVLSFFLVEVVREALRAPSTERVLSPLLLCTLVVLYAACSASVFVATKDFRGAGSALVRGKQRRWIWGVSLLACCTLGGLEYWHEKSTQRTPSHYFIPDGYVGWIKINYGVRGAAALIMRDGAWEFHIPESGVLSTSNEQQFGWAKDKYFYKRANDSTRELAETGWGKGGMIWNNSSGTMEQPGKPSQRSEQFFVGSETQLHSLGETDGEIKWGNLAPRP